MEKMEATFLHVPPYKEIDLLYSLINEEPEFLEGLDKKQFVDTPLHLAAGEGRTQLALEIQRLMPSFGRKLNADGLSPLHVALQRGHTETVMAMVRLNPELVGVQGREGITPLHYAAQTGVVDMVAEFLRWWPESIEKLTVREETAVHVAVRNRKLAAVKVLVGWIKRKFKRRIVLTWEDLEGNTVLHIAASTNQPQVLNALVRVVWMQVNWTNKEGLTALDLAMQLPRHEDNEKALSILRRSGATTGSSVTTQTSFVDYLISSNVNLLMYIGRLGEYLEKDLSPEMRNTALVVAGLIVNTTYQGILTPPSIIGGAHHPLTLNATSSNSSLTTFDFLQAPPAARNLTREDVIASKILFAGGFMLPNSIALAAAIGTILLILPCQTQNFLLHLSIFSLQISTIAIFGSIDQDSSGVGALIAEIAFAVIFLVLLWIKLTGEPMRRRLTIRGHRVTYSNSVM